MDNKYGYRICYQKNSEKLKRHLVTNSYDLAKYEIESFEKNPPLDKNKIILKNVRWFIVPVRNFLEYSKLWRGCPFRDGIFDFIKRSKK